MTEQQAIEKLLVLVGEDPSLYTTNPTSAPVTTAQKILQAVTQEISGQDWFGLDSVTSDVSQLPEYLVEYVITKAAYYYMVGYTGENQFTQELLAQVQQLYQQARLYHTQHVLNVPDFDTLVSQIREQIFNEPGWWFNTTEDQNGNLVFQYPVEYPAIVEEYAKAKAKRLYTAYQTGQLEMLFQPSVEEQELYQKLLEEHNKKFYEAKSLNKLKEEIRYELLAEGWNFNTIEAPWSTIKEKILNGMIPLIVRPVNYKDHVYYDREDKLVKDADTRAEIDGDIQLKVIYDVQYNYLPELFKSYIDLKARRLAKHYSDPQNKYAEPTLDEQILFMKLRTLYSKDIDRPNMLNNDYKQSFARKGWV